MNKNSICLDLQADSPELSNAQILKLVTTERNKTKKICAEKVRINGVYYDKVSYKLDKVSRQLITEGRPLKYPYPWDSFEIIESEIPLRKTFQIKYERKLSLSAKLILNSFKNKYIYYAIDDILDSFELKSDEKETLLTIIYSPVLSLQNNFSINFFNIWIEEVYINEIPKVNRFLLKNSENLYQFSYITVKLFYQTSLPVKKPEPLWW